jgi:hypothetical protein
MLGTPEQIIQNIITKITPHSEIKQIIESKLQAMKFPNVKP